MMEPSMCCRLILLGGMLITVAASNFTGHSTTAITPNTSRHGNHTNTTAYDAGNNHINETSTALPSTNTSERTDASANKTTRSHGTIGPTTSGLKTPHTIGLLTKFTTSGQKSTPSSEINSQNLAYVIIIIVIIVVILTVPSFCIFKKKKGYNVDNHEDAGVPLSAMDQDAFESSPSPKEITPELKMFTANETNAERKGPTSDAVHVAVGDGKDEAGSSVKQGSTSAQDLVGQSEEKLDDIKPGDTDVSNQTSVESLKDLPNENGDDGPGVDVPKAEAAHGAPAESFSDVKLDEPV